MKIFISLVCSLVMLGTVASSHAGDAAAGKAKSMLCAACHGADGHSPNDLWPSMAKKYSGKKE